MTSSDQIAKIASTLDLTQEETKVLLEGSVEVIKDLLDQGYRINFPSLGSFQARMTHPRKSFNPTEKRYYRYPKKKIVQFRASQKLNETVNKEVRHG